MSIKYDLFDCIEPANIYLCKPKQSASCALNGIDKNSFSYSTFLQDIDNITFTVNRYIEIDGEKQESNGYSDIDYLMEVSIDNIGTFIIDTPPTINKDDVETKEVSAKSCEWEMLSRDLVSFKVNTGEDTSIERLIDNNIDVSGRTVNYVSLYDKYNPEYSLLDIIINEKIPDWSVGYVNPIIAVKTPYFDIDSTNVYAFFTQDISKKLQCIFKFDTINRKVNVYSADEIGDDTGISISRNILNQLSIEPQTSDIFTRYKVFGNDELDISQVNFGSDTIEDISYYLNSKYMPQELIDKYNNYIEYKESKRQSYIDKMKEYITTLETRNELVNRVPLDSLNYDWDTFSKEELEEELSYFQGLVNIILKDMLPTSFNYSSNRNSVASFINSHKTTNNMKLYKKQLHLYIHEIDKLIDSYIQNSTSENLGKIIDNIASITTANDLQNILNGAFNYFEMIDYTELQNSMYWWDYEAYTTSIIPNIDIALDNLNLTEDDKKEYNEDWKINWELYGLNELKAQKELYKNKVESVKEYSKPWSNLSSDEKLKYSSEQSYNNLYNEYLKMQTLLNEVFTQYNIIKSKVERYDGELNFLQNELSLISSDVSIKNESFNFTEKDLSILRCFYIDAEYTNENFLVTSYTTSIEKLDVELELLNYAKEDIAKQSRPQYHFSCDIDNIFAMAEYKLWHDSLQNGNFIWVSLDDYNYDKVRIVGITYNPMIPNDNNLEIEFSNMTIWNGKRSDLTNLFDNATSSTSNSISRGSSSSSSSPEISNELIRYILNSKPMSDNLEEQELKRIVANEAQFKVVLADYVTANVVDAKVVNAITSTVNTQFVRDLIVGHITAQEIFSTNTTTDYLQIGENEDGSVHINGSTMQFRDKDGNVYIQLGTDSSGGHSLIIKDKNGTTLLDGSGITANAIADELIVDEMVKKKDKDTNYNGISADKLNIDSVVTSINNGTTTIKSSLIYFDEDNQTLNTKLSEMVTDTNNQFSNYYSKEETSEIVETTIGNTTITTSDGNSVNMKTALNNVIDTAEIHTQTIGEIKTDLHDNYSTTEQTKSEISQTKDSVMLSVENLSSVVGGSGKNLLNNVAESTVKNDLEFTVHTDKTVTVNGTPSVYTYLKLGEFDVEIDKTYRISGCPVGGNSDSGYFLLSQGENNYFETGEGFEFKSNLNETRSLYIGVRANCTIDNLLFKPMVTFANISNLEYEPHTDTVDEKIASIKVEADKISLIVKGEDSEGNVELTDNALNVIAENINLTGKVTFNSFDSDTKETLNGATQKAEQAMTAVNKTVKLIEMHYLASSDSIGVTTSTSGWTTTIQNITSTKKYLWTYQTIIYVDNSTTNTSPIISGVYGEIGATGTGIISVTPLYYLKSNATAPSSPTSEITSISTTSGVWTKSLPTYVKNYTYFTCAQTQYTDGTYRWSTVVKDSALTDANASAESIKENIYVTNTTLIDGGKIYTGSIMADSINTTDLFADSAFINALSTNSIVVGASNNAQNALDSLNSLKIGGTNLIYGTKRMDKWVLTNNNIQSVIIDDNGFGVAHWDRYSTLGWQGISSVNSSDIQPLYLSDLLGKEITISLDVKSEDYELINAESEQGIVIVFALCNADSITRTKYRTNTFYDYTLTDKWRRLSYTTTLTENYFSSGSGEINESTRFYVQIYDRSVYSMDVRKVKLELGNKATDYSQNPNDIENSIYYPNTTIINGGNIMTNSIKADAIDVDNLFAQNITATGTITGATIIGGSISSEGEETNELGNHKYQIELSNGGFSGFCDTELSDGTKEAFNYYLTDNFVMQGVYYQDTEYEHVSNTTIAPGLIQFSDSRYDETELTKIYENQISTGYMNVAKELWFGNGTEEKPYRLAENGTGWFNNVVAYGNQYYFWKDESGYIPTFYYNSNKVTLGATALNASLLFKGNGSFSLEYVGNYLRCNKSDKNALGDSEHLWTQLYARNSTITTSDRNKKRDIKYLSNDDKYIQLFKKIMPCSYMLVNGDRVHIGAIAQDIEDSLEECDLSAEEFGGFCKDIHYIYEKDSEGNDIESTKKIAYDENGNIIYDYSLRYEEFIMLTIFVVQKNMERLERLESQMENILARLDALEGK